MGSDSDRPAPARPRKPGAGQQRPRTDIKQKADKLVRDAGIPGQLAWQVARGDLTLNEVLQKLALKDRVESLINRHDLPKSLATQVAMGQADLEQVLARRRMEAHLARWTDHSVLALAAEHGRPMTVALHGKRWATGRILEVGQYDFVIEVEGAPQTEHKLQAKLAVEAEGEKELRKAIKRDRDRDAVAEPVWKPQDRYGCSDKRLFGYQDESTPVKLTTLEGDVLVGEVSWLGRWEFGMRLKKGGHITVFRHALADLRPA